MTTLKEDAKGYIPTAQVKNISELNKISVDVEILSREKQNAKGELYTEMYIVDNGQEYRIPNIIRGHLKAILEKMPELKYFSVIKQGAGQTTTYQVIPMN